MGFLKKVNDKRKEIQQQTGITGHDLNQLHKKVQQDTGLTGHELKQLGSDLNVARKEVQKKTGTTGHDLEQKLNEVVLPTIGETLVDIGTTLQDLKIEQKEEETTPPQDQ